nr:putative reverse transcriptase domain-containing protein [Tanacetum cinerariifolium]
MKFDWTEKAEAAFQLLKQKLNSAPILALPEGSENFMVYCDASHKGLDAIPMQKEKVIAYASCQLKIHEKNVETLFVRHKANMVVDALSRKEQIKPLRVRALVLTTGLNLLVQILNAQVEARKEDNYETEDLGGMIKNLETCPDGTLCLRNRSWIPYFGTRLDMSTAYHPQMDGQSERTIQTLKDMMHACAGVGDAQLTGPEIIHETTENIIQINKHIQAAHNRKNSYADWRRKPLEFQARYKFMLKVSLWKGVIRFGKRGKLNPRYSGPFKLLAKVGTVAYRLEVLEQLFWFHSTFHVSNMMKCFSDEPLAIPLDEIQIDDKLNFIEEPVDIMDRKVKRLKQSRILILKVRWNSR